MNRKNFLRLVGVLGAGAILTPAILLSSNKSFSYPLRSLLPLHLRGHRLRKAFNEKDFSEAEISEKEVVIVGGGVSGLSSAYFLEKQNISDYVLLEMNDHLGGNAAASQTKGNKFPLGAHYLSLPNPSNIHLIDFLKELKLITEETEKGLVYSEEHLVHAPDERLLYRGNFQEGLVPEYGITTEVKVEIEHFLETMKEWKYKKSETGKDIFSIPLSTSDHSEALLELDKITFDKWLDDHDFKSKELRWFLDYCCRDDYGAGSSVVSAWAGIHYFAGRKAKPALSDPTSVMTWPEGNNFLVKKLAKYSKSKTQTNQLVHQITEKNDEVLIYTTDCISEKKTIYKTKKCISALPSYVNKHILNSPFWPIDLFSGIQHHPWFVAAVSLNKLPESEGFPLAWDNVKFGTKGLGYISNTHQKFIQHQERFLFSVYLAMDSQHPDLERKRLFSMTEAEKKQIVLEELKSLHPSIEEYIDEMVFHSWGHGMVTPYKGSYQKYRDFLEQKNKAKRVQLAHTDYASYSVFEEAFDQGRMAVDLLNKIN